MTVADLISKLATFKQEADVMIYSNEINDTIRILEIAGAEDDEDLVIIELDD